MPYVFIIRFCLNTGWHDCCFFPFKELEDSENVSAKCFNSEFKVKKFKVINKLRLFFDREK